MSFVLGGDLLSVLLGAIILLPVYLLSAALHKRLARSLGPVVEVGDRAISLKAGMRLNTIRYAEIESVRRGQLPVIAHLLLAFFGQRPNVLVRRKRRSLLVWGRNAYFALAPEDVPPSIDEVNRRVAQANVSS